MRTEVKVVKSLFNHHPMDMEDIDDVLDDLYECEKELDFYCEQQSDWFLFCQVLDWLLRR